MSLVKAFLYTLLVLSLWVIILLSILIPFKYFFGTPDDFTHLYGAAKIASTIGSFFVIYSVFWKPKFNLSGALKLSNYNAKICLYLPVIAIGLFLLDKPFWDLEKILVSYQAFTGGERLVFSGAIRSSVYDIFSIVLISPIIEELFFRKFLLGKLLEKNRRGISIFISSLCFSLIHIETLNNLIPAFIGGIILGLVYLKTKRIAYSITLHFLFNLIVILSTNLNFSKTNWILGYNFDLVYWLLSGIGIFLVLFGVNRIRAEKYKE